MYRFIDNKLGNVWLENGYVEKETPYGKGVSFHYLDGLIDVICHALAEKPGKLTGTQFRYLRSSLQLSQKALGKLLGCTEQSVAKWEKYGRIPKAGDFLIRLMYVQAQRKGAKVIDAVATLNAIDFAKSTKIIATLADQVWTAKQVETGDNGLLEAA